MQKINCDVNNCSHNNSGVCYSNRVDISSSSATDNDTCCGSFLDKKHYSDLTNNTNSTGCCDCLICKATECIHNENCNCSLSSINVSGSRANIYTETCCESFEK